MAHSERLTDSPLESIGRIYLDANATTRPFPEVIETVAHHQRLSWANPGSRHAEGRKARRVLEDSRERIAALLGALPGEVIFTSGGTEAVNLAISGLTSGLPEVIALTDGEHPSTLECGRALGQRGWQLTSLPVDGEGRLRTDELASLPWDRLKLVSLILAHNETGVVQDIAELSRRCQQRGVPFHLDAVQAVARIPLNFHETGAAALSLAAHKFHGPRGVGALLLREGMRLSPQLYGGHQEGGRRPGTEPVALVAGMARALELCLSDLNRRIETLATLRDQLEAGLLTTCPDSRVNGSREHRLPNTLNIRFPGVDGEALLVALDLEGIACSLGSTCASGSTEPAPALIAMGLTPEEARSSVRFSVSVDNTAVEIAEAIRRITRVVQRLSRR